MTCFLQNKSKPVDDVEDKEEDGEGYQEELVDPERTMVIKDEHVLGWGRIILASFCQGKLISGELR